MEARLNEVPVAQEGENLWSAILDSVDSRSRATITKNLIILGNRQTGKTSLIERLTAKNGEALASNTTEKTLELGLSYSVLEIAERDESNVKLGIYQLPSPSPPYTALLPLALNPSTLLNSLVLITLDWTRPWLFVKELKSWMVLLESVFAEIPGDNKEVTEGQERLENIFRQYERVNPDGTKSSLGMDTPLLPGMLTNNLGVGIVIVCTKSDQMAALDDNKQLNEDQFEYVQQVLRTIALKYGAALLYTSQSRPETFVTLKDYLLHRLYSSTPSVSLPLSSSQSSSAKPNTAAFSVASSFRFSHSPEFTDRDIVLIPAGWDNEGLIEATASPESSAPTYVPSVVGGGWDLDLRKELAILNGKVLQESDLVNAQGKALMGAESMYELAVVDLDYSVEPSKPASSLPPLEDEQDFLRSQFVLLEEVRKKDPRNAFNRSNVNTTDSSDKLALLKGSNVATAGDESTRQSSSRPVRSPPIVSTTDAPVGGDNNKVLSNFFSSLMAKRTPGSEKVGVQGMSRSVSSAALEARASNPPKETSSKEEV